MKKLKKLSINQMQKIKGGDNIAYTPMPTTESISGSELAGSVQ